MRAQIICRMRPWICHCARLCNGFAWRCVTRLAPIELYVSADTWIGSFSPSAYLAFSLFLCLLRKCHGDMSRLAMYFVFGQNFRSGKVSTFLSCRGCTVRLNFSGILCGYGSLAFERPSCGQWLLCNKCSAILSNCPKFNRLNTCNLW